MLEALPQNVRNVLLSYNFIVKYLEGKISKETFLDTLTNFKSELKSELLSRGIDTEYIESLENPDAESEFHRKATHSRFVRFARKLGLDIATQEDKIVWIKSIDAKKFLDVLSVSAGLLSGIFRFLRWKDSDRQHANVGVPGRELNLDPPENSYKEFEKFFLQMQKGLNIKNMDLWAVKLYFAIICAHMFGDANGRVARNSYFLMRANGLLDEKKSSRRDAMVVKATNALLQMVVMELLRKEGFGVRNYSEANEYRAGKIDTEYDTGYAMHIGYIACKRVLERRRRFRGEKSIVFGNWPKDMQEELASEYQKIRIEWFWMCIKMTEHWYMYFKEMLDKAIIEN